MFVCTRRNEALLSLKGEALRARHAPVADMRNVKLVIVGEQRPPCPHCLGLISTHTHGPHMVLTRMDGWLVVLVGLSR